MSRRLSKRDPILILTSGTVAEWNLWRESRPRIIPDLSDTDLSDMDLTGIDLRGTVLRGTNLQRAILVDGDLTGADLRGATLLSADLEGARLNKARLGDADLWGANVKGCNFTDATYNYSLRDQPPHTRMPSPKRCALAIGIKTMRAYSVDSTDDVDDPR